MFSGERLQRVRRERGWSQERLGEVIGVSRSTIMRLSELGDEATIIVTPAVFVLTVPLPACV